MGCPEEIRMALDELQGIEINTFDDSTRRFTISFNQQKLSENAIIRQISNTNKFEVKNVKAIN